MTKPKHFLQPARKVIDAFGGCRATARALDISPSTVSRWTTPTLMRGTGGRIPQRYWKTILATTKTLSLTDLAGM